MAEERLHKVMAAAGFGSRRACEQMILDGQVQVDGRTVSEVGVKVDPAVNEIVVNGRSLALPTRHLYLKLNKPRGVISDIGGDTGTHRSVAELLPPDMRRVFPVGRLDLNSEGLILLTDDGELAHHLTHPSFEHPKTYYVLVKEQPNTAALETLRNGVELPEGRTAPARVRVVEGLPPELLLAKGPTQGVWLEITLREGKKRQIRHMLAAVDHSVLRLARWSIGPLTMGRTKPGEWAALRSKEIAQLRAFAGLPPLEALEDEPEPEPEPAPRGRAGAGAAAGAARSRPTQGRSAGARSSAPRTGRTGDRPAYGARAGDRPRAAGDERRGGRPPSGGRPSSGGRPARGDRPAAVGARTERPTGDRPYRPRTERPAGEHAPDERPRAPRPAPGGTRAGGGTRTGSGARSGSNPRSGGARPGGSSAGGAPRAGGPRRDSGDRPPRSSAGGGAGAGRSGGPSAGRSGGPSAGRSGGPSAGRSGGAGAGRSGGTRGQGSARGPRPDSRGGKPPAARSGGRPAGKRSGQSE